MAKDKQTVRLNKYIADCTGCARRNADALITNGQVKVNRKAAVMGQQIDPLKDKVSVDGNILSPQRKRYVAFHKPVGLITTKHDPEGRQTVYDRLPERYHHLDPVGRLDRDSSGLLLLSNDGEFIQRLSHPKYKHGKVYRVTVNRTLTQEALMQLEKGIVLQPENQTVYATVQEMRDLKTVVLMLRTGLNRQIRRSFEGLGYTVTGIKRLTVAGIGLGDLKAGQCRELKPSEVKPFMNAKRDVRLKPPKLR